MPTGTFNVEGPDPWDVSRLYTTGEITLIPEPSSVSLMIPALPMLLRRRTPLHAMAN